MVTTGALVGWQLHSVWLKGYGQSGVLCTFKFPLTMLVCMQPLELLDLLLFSSCLFYFVVSF